MAYYESPDWMTKLWHDEAIKELEKFTKEMEQQNGTC